MENREALRIMGPNPHPEPPPSFNTYELPLVSLDPDPDEVWQRLYRCSHASSLHFGRGRQYRFDDPHGDYGVLYVARDVQGTFIETFGDSRGPTGELEIARGDIAQRCVARIEIIRSLRVVDLTGPGLAQIQADARLTAGDNYPLSQRWGRQIFDHRQRPDGILYRARHDQSRLSLALVNRASNAVAETLHGGLLEPRNRPLLIDILRAYRISLLP
jgi:hypothetical protein